MKRDNTEGSLRLWENLDIDPYIIGLWGADGYSRTSSIGLTSIYPKLIQRFRDFLLNFFPIQRLHLRVYLPRSLQTYNHSLLTSNVRICSIQKAKHPAYHIYVNCRPFVRAFLAKVKEATLASEKIPAYFAGRFDGDGSIAKDGQKDCRIVYTTHNEALFDQTLIHQWNSSIQTSLYHYKSARTYVLYVRKSSVKQFIDAIRQYSSKLTHELIAP